MLACVGSPLFISAENLKTCCGRLEIRYQLYIHSFLWEKCIISADNAININQCYCTKSISLRFFRCSHFHGVQYRESFRLSCAMRNNAIQALVRTCTFSHQINLRCHTLWLVTLASCPWKTLCLCLCAHRFTAQDALLVEMLDFD